MWISAIYLCLTCISHYIFMSVLTNSICLTRKSPYIFASSPEASREARRRRTPRVNWVGLKIQHVSPRRALTWPESVRGSPRQPRPPSEEHFRVNKRNETKMCNQMKTACFFCFKCVQNKTVFIYWR